MNNHNIKYREATIDEILNFERKLYFHHLEKRDCEWDEPTAMKCLNYSVYRVCKVITYKNKPIAYIQYFMVSGDVEIKRLWVEEDYRELGIATQIIRELFIDNKNIENIELHTYTYSGLKLFQKLGFDIVGIRRNGSMIMYKILKGDK